jgi:hypothetical protein
MGLFNRRQALPERSLDDIKSRCKVLIVDDEEFAVSDIMKQNGWLNVNWIKDIENMDALQISEAHVFFIDIFGVGKKLGFKDEGLGLIRAIKCKYPEKKICAYSVVPSIPFYQKELQIVDARLSKNADQYEFVSILEKLSKECLQFSNVIKYLTETFQKELKRDIKEKDVRKMLLRLQNSNDFSSSNISHIFNLNNIASSTTIIANIVALFN